MMKSYLDDTVLDRTIRDTDFTNKARKQIKQVVTSESFQDLSCEEIILLLRDEMEQISFRDHLKRYLYRQADMEEPFRSVPDKTWQKMIEYAFEENSAPHSFEPTTTRWGATVKSWLNAQRVRRNTVFLLGFGLGMPSEDVSEMLTKVLMEDDFRLDDPKEVVYRYCFDKGLRYSSALAYLEQYERMPAGETGTEVKAGRFPGDENQLLIYLRGLKSSDSRSGAAVLRRQAFASLYDRCREKVAEIYNRDEEEKEKKDRRVWKKEEITAADLEQMLCSGIPMTASGNLIRANLSQLCQRFEAFRPSRQHMEAILKETIQPDRYDLLTLSFFLHAQDDIPGEERLRRFLEETNAILVDCRMGGVYPAHAYEAFLLICVVSDCPLAVYVEVWEMSFQL